jgi:nucleotide-binding universal stress UspA family protein
MSDRKILVPIDFSANSKESLEYASAFAKDYDAELLIVHVMDSAIENLDGIQPVEAMEGIDAALRDVKPTDETIPYSHRMLEGPPADTILKTAEEENVEMIVMGTHGRSGFKRLVMGSVAEAVVRKAPCPVLTLRQPLATADSDQATTK